MEILRNEKNEIDSVFLKKVETKLIKEKEVLFQFKEKFFYIQASRDGFNKSTFTNEEDIKIKKREKESDIEIPQNTSKRELFRTIVISFLCILYITNENTLKELIKFKELEQILYYLIIFYLITTFLSSIRTYAISREIKHNKKNFNKSSNNLQVECLIDLINTNNGGNTR
jgi:hypothetical protein